MQAWRGVAHHFSNARDQLLAALFCRVRVYFYDLKAHRFNGLAEWLHSNNIDVVRMVPSTLRQLAAHRRGQAFTTMPHVALTDEVMHGSDVALHQ